MKFFLILLFILFFQGCEKRKLIVLPSPCPSVQALVDGYTSGDITIPSGCDILLSQDLRIRDGRMIVEEDVSLFFDGAGLYIEGSGKIITSGTKPIVFTSAYEFPLSGDWNGIHIDGEGILENVVVEYGTSGIYLSGYLEMRNSELRNNLYYGVLMESVDALPLISSTRFYNNSYGAMLLYSDAVTLLSDDLEIDGYILLDGRDGIINSGTWNPYTYLIISHIEIKGAHIHINGAEILIETGPAVTPWEFRVKKGRLSVENTTFSSSDPDYCWGGILFENADPSSYLYRTTVYDGGDGEYFAGIAAIDTPSSIDETLLISDSEIAYSCSDGIYISNSDLILHYSFVHDNARYGVYVDCDSTFVDDNNEYLSNLEGDIAYPIMCP